MNFSSFIFIFYFLPLFFVIYTITPRKWENIAILIASYIFYIWISPVGALIIIFSCVIDFILVNAIRKFDNNYKKIFLALSLILNIGILAYFKYSNFLIAELDNVLIFFHAKTIVWKNVLFLIGISFITFHKISYALDIYFNKADRTNFINYSLYIMFFPKLLQGPIVRYNQFISQLCHHQTIDNIFNGLYRFFIGLAKKVLLADALGIVADRVFNLDFSSLTVGYSWLGIICYTFQIYLDFAGYSDMAIGIAQMLGFNIQENFNWPYLSKNITEFWRRWHMSLSGWFREYLYIPLGGNRVSRLRNYVNLWIVFLVTGFWHGANWTFIFWGIYHGFFLFIDKLIWLKKSEGLRKIITTPMTFFIIVTGWVFFRSNTISYAFRYLARMFDFYRINSITSNVLLPNIISNRGIVLVIMVILFNFVLRDPIMKLWNSIRGKISTNVIIVFKMLIIIVLFLLSVSSLVNNNFKPFIYFRF